MRVTSAHTSTPFGSSEVRLAHRSSRRERRWVVRWFGGSVVRWFGGSVVRCSGVRVFGGSGVRVFGCSGTFGRLGATKRASFYLPRPMHRRIGGGWSHRFASQDAAGVRRSEQPAVLERA